MRLENRSVRIGLLKAMPAKWDVEANWDVFEEQFARHRDSGLDVFVTPECFLDGYAVTEADWNVPKFRSVAQTVGESSFIRSVLDLAGGSKTYIVFGFTELKNGRFYNAALLAAANRDPAVFDRPDELDITREGIRPLSFGGGVHYCLGAQLARLEAAEALKVLFRRLPGLALDDIDNPVWKRTITLRGVVALPATW